MGKRRIAWLTALVILMQTLLLAPVFAADKAAPTIPGLYDAEQPEDPQLGREWEKQMEQSTQAAGITFDFFKPRALQSGEVLRYGVDVSYYQNTIDWQKARADGVEFAFIRVGYRGYGSAGTLVEDTKYKQNIENALKAGIQVGVYIYSQAISEEEAVEEAEFVLQRIKGYNITLPVVMDYEYADKVVEGRSTLCGRLYESDMEKTVSVRKAEGSQKCIAFCAAAEAAGYVGMVYANKSMLNGSLDASKLEHVWLAQYANSADYAGSYEFWQCTGSGDVDGISGNVDLDFWYDNGTLGADLLGGGKLPFRDVNPSMWSYESIKFCYEHGLVAGMTDYEYGPGYLTTRGQVATMLYRMEGKPAVSAECPFTDLTQTYYQKPITWAWSKGYASGYSATEFGPDDPITRQDFVTILYRMVGKPQSSQSLSAFSDAEQIRSYALPAMKWAVEAGIIYGVTDTTLDPMGYTTREQMAAFLRRFVLKYRSE